MKHISLPTNETQHLSFYLAMEEYVARYMTDVDEAFFMWQVRPSVIFGRNQLIENEVNIKFCKENNIEMYRRKSGGGCVYADMNNVMFSYITSANAVGFTFYKYINAIVLMLNKLGVKAHGNMRNDILIDDKKVSGNAFYHISGRCIVHGTMLYDTNMRNMVASITPSKQKLISKGIESVRQRIALLKDYIKINLDDFKSFVKSTLCEDEIYLDNDDITKIKLIEKEYLSEQFIYGNNPKYSIIKKQHIDGVGNIEARIILKNNVIKNVVLMGDFFIVGDLNELIEKIVNVELKFDALYEVLPDNLNNYILNLNKIDFVDILIN